ncbi:hypothetical protein Tco_0509733 [Tanacetum coccineum]
MHDQFSQILETFENCQTPASKHDAPTFSIMTRSGITTHGPPYPAPSTVNNNDRIIEEGGLEGEETIAFQRKETP